MGMWRLGQSRAWNFPNIAADQRLGLRQFRMLVATSNLRKSPSRTNGPSRSSSMGGGPLSEEIGNGAARSCEKTGANISKNSLRKLSGANVYVTIDLDCLRVEEAITNWENGRFSVADLAWALGKLREHCQILAGDICGAFSPPVYARWKQRFASEFDHPKLARPSANESQQINLATVEKLWPLLAQ